MPGFRRHPCRPPPPPWGTAGSPSGILSSWVFLSSSLQGCGCEEPPGRTEEQGEQEGQEGQQQRVPAGSGVQTVRGPGRSQEVEHPWAGGGGGVTLTLMVPVPLQTETLLLQAERRALCACWPTGR